MRQLFCGYTADVCVRSASVTSNVDEVYLNITFCTASIPLFYILHLKKFVYVVMISHPT